MLRVRVAAPPVDGRANAALERLLASALGAPKSAVSVAVGGRSREKLVDIDGIDQKELRSRFPSQDAG